jgi:hypothetical protein
MSIDKELFGPVDGRPITGRTRHESGALIPVTIHLRPSQSARNHRQNQMCERPSALRPSRKTQWSSHAKGQARV